MRKKIKLIYASTRHSADLYYATRFQAPDPVVWFREGKRTFLVLSPLEAGRGIKMARVDEVLCQAEITGRYLKREKKRHKPSGPVPMQELLPFLLRERGIGIVEVPGDFPLIMAEALRAARIEVVVCQPFFPEREFKDAEEIRGIVKGQRQAESGLKRGMEILTASKIRAGRKLFWGGAVLTSERLRMEIDDAVRKAGGVPADTIVAGGLQACDPHECGSGPLHASETIIMDIFPYDQRSGYYGDLTRTVVKGKAGEGQRKMYATVRSGQKTALESIRAGIDGAGLQNLIKEEFECRGYATERRGGEWVGFFHGLGHGLGMEVHEVPRIAGGRLKAGQVVTVEPGLYYPEIGGVRLENVVVVEKGGCRDLTKAPYRFEIP